MQAWGAVVTESLLNDVVAQNVMAAQGGQQGGIGEKSRPLDDSGKADFDLVFGQLRKGRVDGEEGFFPLSVERGGEEEKLAVAESKTVTPLGDAAFSNKEALYSLAEGFADDCPFLESHIHEPALDLSFRNTGAKCGAGIRLPGTGDAVHFSFMSPHSLLDRRALEMDRIVAQRLDENPEAVLGLAKKNLERWLGQCDASVRSVLIEWTEILERPPERIREVLLGEDEESVRLRQSSPFCGILTPGERTEILMRHR